MGIINVVKTWNGKEIVVSCRSMCDAFRIAHSSEAELNALLQNRMIIG